MSLLGYDLWRLGQLRRQLLRSAERLERLRSADPLAAAAMTTVESIRRQLLDTWSADVVGLVLVDPLGAASRTGPFEPIPPHDGFEPDEGLEPTDGPVAGWWVFGHQPLRQPREVPATHTVDRETWTRTFDDLAARRIAVQEALAWHPDDVRLHVRLLLIDELVRRRAAAWSTAASTAGVSPVDLLDDTTPLAAALVAQHLDVDDRAFATLATRIVRAWHASDRGSEHIGPWFAGVESPADVMVRALLARPTAATDFLRRVEPHELFPSARHDDLVARLLVTGTAPDRVDEETAGEILRPLLEWLPTHHALAAGDGPDRSAQSTVAAAVAPWLANLGARADRWGWTYERGDDALRWLVEDRAGVTAMAAAVTTWRDRAVTTPLVGPDGRIDTIFLHDLSTTVLQVDTALRARDIDTAASRKLVVDLVFKAAGSAISAAAPGPGSAAVDLGLTVFTPVAMRALDRAGLVESPDRLRAEARSAFGDLTVDMAVIAVTGIVGGAIERGELPPDALDGLDLDGLDLDDATCRAREVTRRLHEFVTELSPRVEPATLNALVAATTAFTNAASVAMICE